MRLFIAYKRSPDRMKLVKEEFDRPESYLLWGLRQFTQAGFETAHNLDIEEPAFDRKVNRALNRLLKRFGAPGGDWLTILRHMKAINRSDILLSTVDNVGIPIAFFKWLGLIRTPVLFTSVGLPERLEEFRSPTLQRVYKEAFRSVERFVSYSIVESEILARLFGLPAPRSGFVPLGVMERFFYPSESPIISWDVVSVGGDSTRDFRLLADFATAHPEKKVLIVASDRHSYLKEGKPRNLSLEFNIPLMEMKQRLESAKVVVLPVKSNSYSGATTTLLQAMCLGKCVIVSAVEPIRKGYGLTHAKNCILVEPESYPALESAISSTLEDSGLIEYTGTEARKSILENFTWNRYAQHFVSEMEKLSEQAH